MVESNESPRAESLTYRIEAKHLRIFIYSHPLGRSFGSIEGIKWTFSDDLIELKMTVVLLRNWWTSDVEDHQFFWASGNSIFCWFHNIINFFAVDHKPRDHTYLLFQTELLCCKYVHNVMNLEEKKPAPIKGVTLFTNLLVAESNYSYSRRHHEA